MIVISNKTLQRKIEISKIDEYALMKVVATILVVIGHSAYIKINNVDYSFILGPIIQHRFTEEMNSVIRFIYIFHMPLFFAVSGAVYYVQNNYFNKYITLEEVILKKVKRLLIPYVSVGILYVIPIKLVSKYYTLQYTHKAFVYDILNGVGHLWFLLTLFWIFIIFYILRNYVYENNKILFLLIILCSYFFSKILGGFMPSGIKGNIKFLIYFCIGYFFEQYREKYNSSKNMIIKTIGTFLVSYILYVLQKNMPNIYLKDLILLILQCALLLLIYNLCHLSIKYLTITNKKLYKLFDKYSFSIYLFHDPLNYLILYIVSVYLINKSSVNIVNNFIFAFVLIIIFRIIINIIICIFMEWIISKFSLYAKLKKTLLYICLIVFTVSFINVVYDKENNINVKNEIYTPKLEHLLLLANVTDENWDKGILKDGNILLVNNNDSNKRLLENARYLKFNNINKQIKDIEIKDSNWIYIILDNINGIKEFRYPNYINVIKDTSSKG